MNAYKYRGPIWDLLRGRLSYSYLFQRIIINTICTYLVGRNTAYLIYMQILIKLQNHIIPNLSFMQKNEEKIPFLVFHLQVLELQLLNSFIVVMQRQASKKQTSKHHDRSLDDFLKHFKKYNLKSERQDRLHSPDPFAPYRQNTTHTLERSRTLSGKQSRKTNKTTRQKIEKILDRSKSKAKGRASNSNIISKSQSATALPNPADLIAQFSKRIREAQQILQGRSKMGSLLCKKFLEMLNQLVENMVLNLQKNMEELEKSIYERLQKEIGERAQLKTAGLQRQVAKLEREALKLLEKQNYNTNLIYHLRLQNIDIDQTFGKCIFGSDDFGGLGYGHTPNSKSESSSLNHLSSDQLVFVKRKQGKDADKALRREEESRSEQYGDPPFGES